MASTAVNTVRQPRVNVCTTPRPVISVSVRSVAMVVNPHSSSRAPPAPASARGGASYDSPTTTSPPSRDAPAHAANTVAGPLTASSRAATAGPPSVADESSRPRTALARVSCSGDRHSAGSSAECAGR